MSKLLIVVDMQNDFVTGVLGTKEACNIVPDVVKLVDEFDGDIAFTKDTHHDNYLDTQEGKKLPVVHCIEGTDGWEIIPELKKYTTADNKRLIGIFNKPTFGSTELAKALSDKDYDEIIFCGVCTGICVISNAMLVKATLPETPVKIVESCCACVTPESHNTALEAMKTCQMEII